jgi:predicted O-methyltransferase YrrM
MLTRVADFAGFFQLTPSEKARVTHAAAFSAQKANGMMHENDYDALGAILLALKPKTIFEIGTYLGVTADFCLSLLPESRLVSIAYVNDDGAKQFNNSELPADQIGIEVSAAQRSRFVQIIGNSHLLSGDSLIQKHGRFELVLIDGDHSFEGVSADTSLATSIAAETGAICWHDANPKPRYLAVRQYLESERSFTAIATADTYVGGIAVWSKEIERRACCPAARSG